MNLERAGEGGREKSLSLEMELIQAEKTVTDLRTELASVKQDLQDTMELCSEHENLMEERNRELENSDSEIR